jgi:hypothetical protein
MVEDGTSDDTAADDDDFRMAFHGYSPVACAFVERIRNSLEQVVVVLAA